VTTLKPITLTAEAFAPFGEVIETSGHAPDLINEGTTERFDALARLDIAANGGGAILSIFRAQPRQFPLALKMMERHPLGSQAFMPLSADPFLVVVAEDQDGRPGPPEAFITNGAQGVNYRRNIWHHPVLALSGRRDFLVADRAGPGTNLEEYYFPGAPVMLDAGS
jgi:ureidoglycolate lyase